MKLRRIRLEFERTETVLMRRRTHIARWSHVRTFDGVAGDFEVEAENDATVIASPREERDESEE